jgi:hypothetical protein
MSQRSGDLATAELPPQSVIRDAIGAIRREVAAIAPDRSRALQLIAERAQSLTAATGAAIAVVMDGSVMVCLARAGLDAPPRGAKLDAGSGFSGECMRSGRSLRCDDAETDDRVDKQTCKMLGIRSMVAVPLEQRNRVIGLLEVFSPYAYKFNDRDEIVLQELAEFVSMLVGVPHPRSADSDQSSEESVQGSMAAAYDCPATKTAANQASRLIGALSGTPERARRLVPGSSVMLVTAVIVAFGIVFWGGLPRLRKTGVDLWRSLPIVQRQQSIPITEQASSARDSGLESATTTPPASSVPANYIGSVQVTAQEGNAAAQFALGTRYAIGDGVPQDHAEAARWFTKAAEQGHAMAESMLSAYYWQGRGVQQDLIKAYFWLLVAHSTDHQIGRERRIFLASHMSPAQVAAATALADEWIRKHRERTPD